MLLYLEYQEGDAKWSEFGSSEQLKYVFGHTGAYKCIRVGLIPFWAALKMKFRYGNFYIAWTNVCMCYTCGIPVTTVISASFQVPYQMAALLL